MSHFDTVRHFIDAVHLGEWTGPTNRRQAREALAAIEANHTHDLTSAANPSKHATPDAPHPCM